MTMRLVKHSSSPTCSASRPNRVYRPIDFTAAVLPYSNFAMEPEKVFLAVTPMAGIAVSSMIFIGVLCGVFAKWNAWQDSEEKEFGVRTWITILALLPDLMLPVVFACAWIWIRQGRTTSVFWFVFVVA